MQGPQTLRKLTWSGSGAFLRAVLVQQAPHLPRGRLSAGWQEAFQKQPSPREGC